MSRLAQNLLTNEDPPRKLTPVEPVEGPLAQPASPPSKARVIVLAAVTLLAGVSLAVMTYVRHRRAQVEVSVPARTAEPAKATDGPSAGIELGTRLFKERDYDGALREFLAAQKSAKGGAAGGEALLVDIGMAYKAKKDFKNARSFYQAAIKLNPRFAPAYNNLAMVSADEKDWASAIRLLKKAIDADPKQIAFVLNLAKVYEKTSQWALAGRYYSQYVASPGADSLIRNLVGKRLEKIDAFARSDGDARERR